MMGTGQPLQEQERTLHINFNMFTTRDPLMPDGVPFNLTETHQIMRAYKKFLDSDKTVDLICRSGKEFPVRYDLDVTRPPGDRLLIYWDWLAPMFWGPPPGNKSWTNHPTIMDFIAQNVHLERCNVLATDACPCSVNRHKVVEPGLERQDKGRLNELLCAVRLQRSASAGAQHERYHLDPGAQEDVKQFLSLQQRGMAHLLDTARKDLSALNTIAEGMARLVRS